MGPTHAALVRNPGNASKLPRASDGPLAAVARTREHGDASARFGERARFSFAGTPAFASSEVNDARRSSAVSHVLRGAGEPLAPATVGFLAERFSGAGGVAPPRAGAGVVAPAPLLPTNRRGDRFEREADRVAASVVAGGAHTTRPSGETARFADFFGNERLYRGTAAADSARELGARAYTVGSNIVFGRDAYDPDSTAGRALLAHELTHAVQQSEAGSAMVMGTWDAATTDCSGASSPDRWIERVVVDQEGSQHVTAFWSDGAQESDMCSTGKGHCCVDSADPSGVAATVEQSHRDGSNCTPITQHQGFPVKNRVRNHGGVEWWTEFEPSRAIALHEYAPVDGSPLSHGCVRLHHDMARTIFCNVRQNQTWVQVHGFARPSCDSASLQREWLNDFATGGSDLSKADGDEAANIRETRRELNAAFGRTLTPAEMNAFTAKDIPRCTSKAPLPKNP